MVSTGLIAVDATILATAVPSIVKDLGGFASFPWLFSVYLLAQAVSVPVYAKLADTVGRKPLMLLGIGLFLLGSVLCGFAWSMPALIAFRAVQGLGAGAVQPMADHHRRRPLQRGRAGQGAGLHRQRLGRVVGRRPGPGRPVLPARRVALDLLRQRAALPPRRRAHPAYLPRAASRGAVTRSTTLGAVLLMASMTLLILGVLEGGQAWAWSSPGRASRSSSTGAVLLVAFVFRWSGARPSRCCPSGCSAGGCC